MRNRLTCTTAAVLALFAVAACSDDGTTGFDDGLTPIPQFGVSNPANGPGQCMANDAVAYSHLNSWVNPGSDPVGLLNCTANDIRVASANILSVNGVPYDPLTDPPIQCTKGQNITLGLDAELAANSNEVRADIGVWIATDGGDGETGACNHYNVIYNNPNVVNPDGDFCGGMDAPSGNVTVALGQITVPCLDPDGNGFLDIGSCIGWKIPGDDEVCPDDRDANGTPGQATDFRAGTLPANKAKCNCDPFQLDITILESAKLEVRKACTPTTDNGTFDLKIDNVVEANDAACGGTTGIKTVSAGTSENPGAVHTFAEADFTTANYTSTYACVNRTGGAARGSGNGVGPHDITLQPDDDVICTFTNVRHASLAIQKSTVGGTAQFGYTVSGSGLSAFTRNTDTQGNPTTQAAFPITAAQFGDKYVTETALAGWTLTNITCTANGATVVIGTGQDGAFNQNTSAGFDPGDNTVKVTVAAGQTPTCTFVNTKDGSLAIQKQTVGGTAQFGYTVSGSGLSAFNRDTDAQGNPTTQAAFPITGAQLGDKYVTETALPGWDLTNITCTANGATVVIGTGQGGGFSMNTTPGFDPGDNTVKVTIGAGNTPTCTFVNTKRATVTVFKVRNGTLPLNRAWTFEIRTGASLASAGTVRATGTAALLTGQVDFSCSPNPNDFCMNVSGVANFVPGAYQLCETGMPAGWTNNITSPPGFTPLGATPEGGDNSTECVDITLAAGATGVPAGIPNPISNIPPPGGDARTIGYWKNWSSCSNGNQYAKALERGDWDRTLDGNLPQTIGDLVLNGALFADQPALDCEDARRILDKRAINNRKKMANDAAYGLAAQLLAAKLNIQANAKTCADANTAIADGQALLEAIGFDGTGSYLTSKVGDPGDRADALALAETLDDYNNNLLCP